MIQIYHNNYLTLIFLKYHHLCPFPPSLTTKKIDYANFLDERKSLCQCPPQYYIQFTKKNSLCQFPTLIDTIFRPKNLCQYAGCDMPIDLR